MNKKILLVFGLGSCFLILIRSEVIWDFFVSTGTVSILEDNFELVHNVLVFFPIVLICGVLALLAPNTAFQAWARFSNLTVPVVLLLTFIINLNLHHTSGGFMNMDADIDLLFVLFLYVVFIIGSFVQIIRGSMTKKPNSKL